MARDTVTIDNRRTHLALRFLDSNGMIAEAHLDWEEAKKLSNILMEAYCNNKRDGIIEMRDSWQS